MQRDTTAFSVGDDACPRLQQRLGRDLSGRPERAPRSVRASPATGLNCLARKCCSSMNIHFSCQTKYSNGIDTLGHPGIASRPCRRRPATSLELHNTALFPPRRSRSGTVQKPSCIETGTAPAQARLMPGLNDSLGCTRPSWSPQKKCASGVYFCKATEGTIESKPRGQYALTQACLIIYGVT